MNHTYFLIITNYFFNLGSAIHFNDYKDNGLNLEFKYHDHDEMTRYLRATSARFPNLTALYSIGKSVQGDA